MYTAAAIVSGWLLMGFAGNYLARKTRDYAQTPRPWWLCFWGPFTLGGAILDLINDAVGRSPHP